VRQEEDEKEARGGVPVVAEAAGHVAVISVDGGQPVVEQAQRPSQPLPVVWICMKKKINNSFVKDV
jgi:hypothetical protein